MRLRRFTLTNPQSKKVENHFAALEIYFMTFNFARPHQALQTKKNNRITPALAAGVALQPWAVDDLVRLLNRAVGGKGTTAWRPAAWSSTPRNARSACRITSALLIFFRAA